MSGCGCGPYAPCKEHEAYEREEASRFDALDLLHDARTEIARLKSELQLVTASHESVGAVLREHKQTIARLWAVLEAVWITVPSQFSGPEAEQHAKVLNSIPRAIAGDWPAVRAAGVVLPGEE